jgi:hypothetical protein
VPTIIAPEISHYGANVIQAVFPATGIPSYVTGNIIFVYLGLTSGLMLGKYSAQAYYHVRYGDTNSGHLLYDHELHAVMRLYQGLNLERSVLEIRVSDIFQHLVVEIRRSKAKNTGNPLEPISLAWTKPQLKGVLTEFMRGNDDPYQFFYRLAHMKQNFLTIRLQERVSEIDHLLVEELPRSPEIADFGAPYIRPSTPRNHAPRHRRRATVSELELHKHPKLHRYVTQLGASSVDGVHKAQELELVRSLLISKGAQVKALTQSVPVPLVATEGDGLRSPQPLGRGLRIDI